MKSENGTHLSRVWLWPSGIIVLALMVVITATTLGATMRPVIVLGFLFICPGMAIVRFFDFGDAVIEWTLAIALSLAIDAIVVTSLLYAHMWSVTTMLSILIGISCSAAGISIVNMIIGQWLVSHGRLYSDLMDGKPRIEAKTEAVGAEFVQTQEELRTTKEALQRTQDALRETQVRLAELEEVKPLPSAFVKTNNKKSTARKRKNPRKKRRAK